MKSFFSLAFLCAAANNISISEVFDVAPTLPTLEDVYGKTAAFKTLKGSHGPSYNRKRTTKDCSFPLEIVIVQDNTASFQDDFYQMKDVELDLMVNGLSQGHPDSKFGVVSFRDKPMYSLGEPEAGDYCLRFEASLSSNVAELKAVYERLESNGGADPSEAQFLAIVAAAQSATPGWTTTAADEPTRLIVVVTDSPPHFADDGLNTYAMSPFSGSFDEANADLQCLSEYYPNPAQVKSALTARGAYLAALVYDGAWWNELPTKSWTWFNSYLGQSSSFVTSLTADSSNFWTNLNHIITSVEELECVQTSTTAPTVLPAASTLVAPPLTRLPTAKPSTLVAPPVEPTLPTCPPCEVFPCPCAAPAVEILLRNRPSHLKLLVDNGKFNKTNQNEDENI